MINDRKMRKVLLVAAMVFILIAVATPLCALDACAPSSSSMPAGGMAHPPSSPASHAGRVFAAAGCDLVSMTRGLLDNAATPGTPGPLPLLMSVLAVVALAALRLRGAPQRLAAACPLPSIDDLRGVRLLI